MPSEPPQASVSSELRQMLTVGVVALGLVMGCMLIALVYIGQALQLLPSADAVARSVQARTGPVRALTIPRTESRSAADEELYCGPLHLLFQTPDGEPVGGFAQMHHADVEHSQRHRQSTVGEDGRMTVPNVRCRPSWQVHFAWTGIRRGPLYTIVAVPGQDTYVVEVGPHEGRDAAKLRSRMDCPLRVLLEEGDGEPVSGLVRLADAGTKGQLLELDADGGVDFPDAPCVSNPTLWLRRSEGARGERVSFLREPDDAPVVVVTLDLTAELRVVDPAGERIEEAEVRTHRHTIERLPSGDHLLTGSLPELEVTVYLSGEPDTTHRVPLDGGLHELVVDRLREVEVRLQCDQCAGTVLCGKYRCDGSPPDLLCTCPSATAELGMQTPDVLSKRTYTELLAVVPPGVDRVEVERSGERGSVELQVAEHPDRRIHGLQLYRPTTGEVPHRHHSVSNYPTTAYLGRIGDRYLSEDLLPGPWLLSWKEETYVDGEGWQTETRTRAFELAGGEVLDLGAIGG